MTLRDMTISDVERLDEAGQDVRVFHMDEADFRAFYDRTARALWAYLYRLTRDGGRADDLLQETYYRFLRTTDAPADPAHRRNYLYRIATNLVRDEARRAARGSKGPETTTASCCRRRRAVARSRRRLGPMSDAPWRGCRRANGNCCGSPTRRAPPTARSPTASGCPDQRQRPGFND